MISRKSWTDSLVVSGLLVLASLPFLDQPIHLDDAYYLDLARNAFRNPLFPLDVPYLFEGRLYKDMAATTHPPLTTYFLALNLWLAGQRVSEVALHLAFLIFPLLAGVSLCALARRFGALPKTAALLVLWTPAAAVLSHTLMTDVAALAFSSASLAAFIRGVDGGDRRWRGWGSVALTLALFTVYQGVLVVALVVLYAWLRSYPLRKLLLPLGVPLSLLGAWVLASALHFQRWPLSPAVEYASSHGFWNSPQLAHLATAGVVNLGGATLFPLALYGAFWSVLGVQWGLLLVLISFIPVFLLAGSYTHIQKLLFAFFFAGGLYLIVLVTLEAWQDLRGKARKASSDNLFLWIWFAAGLISCVFAYFTAAARYLLPFLVPAVFLYLRQVRRAFVRHRIWSGAVLALTLAWGMIFSIVDYDFAGLYPRMARAAREMAGERATLWFGGEWGFRHYLEREGGRVLSNYESLPRGGDWIARPRIALPYALAADVESMMIPVNELGFPLRRPLRTLDAESRAGFHALFTGFLPLGFSRRTFEELKMYQVSYLSERLPEVHVSGPGGAAPRRPYPVVLATGGSRRLALLQSTATRVRYPLEDRGPQTAQFFVAALPGRASPVSFHVRAETPRGEEVLYRSVEQPVSDLANLRWARARCVLPTGSRALILEVGGDGAVPSYAAAWGDFVLLESKARFPESPKGL